MTLITTARIATGVFTENIRGRIKMRKEKILEILENAKDGNGTVPMRLVRQAFDKLVQPGRYTKEELRVFQHGISLSLLSKRSSQHWFYDEDTATEIKFLERLYEKVGADMRGEQE